MTNFLCEDLCKEIAMNTEHKPSCIDLIINEPNMRLRITSGYHRGIHLSKLIRIYTKFDPRTIKLLQLVRILSKVNLQSFSHCSIPWIFPRLVISINQN